MCGTHSWVAVGSTERRLASQVPAGNNTEKLPLRSESSLNSSAGMPCASMAFMSMPDSGAPVSSMIEPITVKPGSITIVPRSVSPNRKTLSS